MAEGLGLAAVIRALKAQGLQITVIPVIPVGAGNPRNIKTKPPDFRFNIIREGGRGV